MDKEKILIIDDTNVNLTILSNILNKANYEVYTALSWKSGKEILRTITPILIILDIVMPEIDGIKACKILKRSNLCNIPVIFISSLSNIEDKIEAFNAGAVDYITKPFFKEEIISRVKLQVNLRKALLNLQNKESELRILNSAKDMFLSIIAHDLKNPVSAILGLIQLQKLKIDMKDFEGITKTHFHIKNSIETLNDTMNNILNWALLQKDFIKFEKENIILFDSINDCINIYKNSIITKNLNVIINIDKNISILFDEDIFKTVIRNLLSNAIKFSNINGEIRFDYYQNDYINISISDNGIGINKQLLPKLFKIDEKISTEGTLKEKGTGLGLIMCYDLISKNNGTLIVESEENLGTKFTIRLPLSN